jgi:hypothetical protein
MSPWWCNQQATNLLGNLASQNSTINSAWNMLSNQANVTANSAWNMLSNQADSTVNLNLKSIGEKVITDMAGEAASYLADNEELSEDYVLAVVDLPDGTYEARAYRKSELLESIEDPHAKAIMKQSLENNTLLHLEDAKELPKTPSDDAELVDFAKKIQTFLDKNQKTISMLDKGGYMPW